MLTLLRIRNLALIDEVELEFEGGFVTVTGETGAGKSILLGALSLLAGNRAERSVIRQGRDSCEIEALITLRDSGRIDAALADAGLPACEDGQLMLRRVIQHGKAGRVVVNGALSTVAVLQEIGSMWIDFHGPGEPQKLFHDSYQLELFDVYAGNGALLEEYAAVWRQWRAAVEAREQLAREDQLSEDEVRFLQQQIARIEAICPDVATVEQLEADFARLSRIHDIVGWSRDLEEGINGDDGVVERLAAIARKAGDLASIEAAASECEQRLSSLIIELQDIGNEYSALASGADLDESAVADIQQRMQQWLELKRAYGPTVEAVCRKRGQLAERLDRGSDVVGTLRRMDDEIESLQAKLTKLAGQLSKRRRKAAPEFAAKVSELLTSLGFKKVTFAVEIVSDAVCHERGDSHCRFLFSPNPGQAPAPVNKIASSGETARVMLALKAVLAAGDDTPVLVFDEVDANVGGEVGVVVGRELRRLGGRHQVLCVTHLPQVAAQGQSHLMVSKEQDDDSTRVEFVKLKPAGDDRLAELARMLGDRDSRSARNHAKELLELFLTCDPV